MSTTPKVSVLIPAYNYGHFLDETIQSVLDQTFTDFELVIVDNCSTDNTEEIVSKYLDDKRVSFYTNATNLGMVGNWNKCLEYAKGTYIKFLCADDKFHPHLLQRFVAVMEQYPNVMLVTSFSSYFGVRSKQRKAPLSGHVSGPAVRKNIIIDGGKNWLGEPTAVMFRSSGLAVGGFNPQLVAFVDLEYWLRLLCLGDCYVIPESLYFFRWHEQSETANLRKKKFEKVFESYQYMTSVKRYSRKHNCNDIQNIDALIKLRASRCAALMYKVLPKIYEKDHRDIFRKAWQIGYAEKVIFDPLWRLLQRKIKSEN